jgi:hypothetical protein
MKANYLMTFESWNAHAKKQHKDQELINKNMYLKCLPINNNVRQGVDE